ncbi:MAG: hypothetical protein ACOYL6_13725 [Bacteriovoracaceae bacterium]
MKIIFISFLMTISLSALARQSGNLKATNVGLTRDQWDKVITKIESIYSPYLAISGIVLKINRDWLNNDANAYTLADLDNSNIRWIRIMGGMARSEWSSEDSLAAVLCHEYGHHLGGYSPYYGSDLWNMGWGSSSEGAADYFAATKCLREYFEDQNNEEYIQGLTVPLFLREQCEKQWKDPKDSAICIRSSLAGRQLLKIWTGKEYSFETPDPKKVVKPLQSYASTQCRLDTYFQGSLCTSDKSVMPLNEDVSIGVCTDTVGSRPECWFLKR